MKIDELEKQCSLMRSVGYNSNKSIGITIGSAEKILAVAKAAQELRTATHNFYIANVEDKSGKAPYAVWEAMYNAGEALDEALAEMEKE